MKALIDMVKTEESLPIFEKNVLVRAYRDTWLDGPQWVEARRVVDDCTYETREWYWEPDNFDEYLHEEVDYWFEIPLIDEEGAINESSN
jgi:hypothetical protein